MKNLKEYIYEANKTEIKNYFDTLNKNNKLVDCINSAINNTNNKLNIFKNNDLEEFTNDGRIIGKLIELSICQYIFNNGNDGELNGFEFKKGNHNTEKDLHCKKSLISDNDPSYYGIEIKTSKTNTITGNKSYAKDKQVKKDRNSFHILIFYKLNNGQIASYTAYFGYLTQKDWGYGKSGNNSKLNSIKNSNYFIEIKK